MSTYDNIRVPTSQNLKIPGHQVQKKLIFGFDSYRTLQVKKLTTLIYVDHYWMHRVLSAKNKRFSILKPLQGTKLKLQFQFHESFFEQNISLKIWTNTSRNSKNYSL